MIAELLLHPRPLSPNGAGPPPARLTARRAAPGSGSELETARSPGRARGSQAGHPAAPGGGPPGQRCCQARTYRTQYGQGQAGLHSESRDRRGGET
eukprot:759213-Hanusia_phi.AAC.4